MIGLLWASMGSIIGSGWLFGAQKGLMAAGPAAIISWVIGGFAILVLALIHAELGGMYPVSGGTARFPHDAFGGAAGASFGWFSWLQAATVAPIEVSAMITYGQHYSFAQSWLDPVTGVLGEYSGFHHFERDQRARDIRREAVFRDAGLECVEMLGGDLMDPMAFLARLRQAYARASRRPVAERRWTTAAPPWWVPTFTVDQRRALTPDQRQRLLRHRIRAA